MIIKGLLAKIVGIAIYVLAFVALLSIIVLAINNVFVIVTDEQAIRIMTLISKYAGILLILLVSLKCALKLPLFLTIPYLVLIALVVILEFFHPIYESIVQTITGTSAGA